MNTTPSATCQSLTKTRRPRRWHRGEYEEKICAHPGRLRDGIAREQRHQCSRKRRRKTGRCHDCAEVHAGFHSEHRTGQHRRLHDDDVGHRQERGDACEQFDACCGLVFRKFEESFEHGFCFLLESEQATKIPRTLQGYRFRYSRPQRKFQNRPLRPLTLSVVAQGPRAIRPASGTDWRLQRSQRPRQETGGHPAQRFAANAVEPDDLTPGLANRK
jgi:hypothetical protein